MCKISSERKIVYWLLAIIGITFVVYLPALKNGFVSLDDGKYIINNLLIQHLSIQNVFRIFSEYFDGHYHPLVLLSLAVDFQLSGMQPLLYHITNIAIHLLNTLLVFYFIFLISKDIKIAFITSLLFGVHTLNVEAVAWISSRKNLIYGFFYLTSVISYIKYIELNKHRYYVYALLLFIVSLISKGQALTLSLILILIDFIKQRNLLDKYVILEKIPFFALSVMFGIITMTAQKYTGYLINLPTEDASFFYRVLYAAYGLVQYIIKLIFPINLSAICLYPEKIGLYMWICVALVLIIAAIAVWAVKSKRNVAFGILFFIFNISIMLKLVPVSYFIIADRYIYISAIGFYFLVGLFYKTIMSSVSNKKLLIMVRSVFIVYLIFLGVFTYNRTKVWENSLSLWDNVLTHYPNFTGALNDRALAFAEFKDFEAAIKDFNRCIELDPAFYRAYMNRGNVKKSMGDFKGAIRDYNKTIELKPNSAHAYYNRASARKMSGDIKGAQEDLSRAAGLRPDYVHIYFHRGNLFYELKDFRRAIKDYTKAIELKPDYSEAYFNRGIVLMQMGRRDSGLQDIKKAAQLGYQRARDFVPQN